VNRLRAACAALALAALTATAGCQNLVQAPVPASPACPPGQHWAATPGGQHPTWKCAVAP
jgi:hypothetical protein